MAVRPVLLSKHFNLALFHSSGDTRTSVHSHSLFPAERNTAINLHLENTPQFLSKQKQSKATLGTF